MFRDVRKSSVTAGQIARHVGGAVHGDAAALVHQVCALSNPKTSALSFSSREVPISQLPSNLVLLIGESDTAPAGLTSIRVKDPRLAFAYACAEFFEARPAPSVAPSAVIDPTARIGRDVTVGPGCIIGPEVEIGDRSELRGNVIVGPRVKIGRSCLIKSGAVIGEEGFGIAKDSNGRNVRIPQFGSVVIGDEVEIGSLTTVTSGTLDPVLIADRVKIDDHVHIGHNAVIGSDAIITACSEMGRVKIGRGVWIGPNTSIKEGIEICDDAFVGIGSVIIRNIEVPGVYAGVPARMLRANAV